MKVNRTGITRIVIELDSVVVKIPNFAYSWLHFLKGLVANIHESQTYRWHKQSDLLCPVVFTSWGGWVLVMKKADVERFKTEVGALKYAHPLGREKSLYQKWIDAGLDGDDKSDNYGYYENRLVKIDYGN